MRTSCSGLNGYTISIPPLRERREDIRPLSEYFLKRQRRDMGKTMIEGVAGASLRYLEEYHWPGNVRQLQSVIRHAMLHTVGTVITPTPFPTLYA